MTEDASWKFPLATFNFSITRRNSVTQIGCQTVGAFAACTVIATVLACTYYCKLSVIGGSGTVAYIVVYVFDGIAT